MLRRYLQVMAEPFLCPFLPLSKISIPLLVAILTTDKVFFVSLTSVRRERADSRSKIVSCALSVCS
jgi:hypothetical protein